MKKIYLMLSSTLFLASYNHATSNTTDSHPVLPAERNTPSNTLHHENTEPLEANPSHLSWNFQPRILLSSHDLKNNDRDLTLKIQANEIGKITQVIILKSSGITAVDQKVVRAVYRASFRPYKEHGIARPFTIIQPFSLNNATSAPARTSTASCYIAFDSRVWSQQQAGAATAFQYKSALPIALDPELLQGQDRQIDLQFKLSRKNVISELKLLKSSGNHNIDKEVLKIFENYAEINASPRFWQFYKRTMTDQIQLKRRNCPNPSSP